MEGFIVKKPVKFKPTFMTKNMLYRMKQGYIWVNQHEDKYDNSAVLLIKSPEEFYIIGQGWVLHNSVPKDMFAEHIRDFILEQIQRFKYPTHDIAAHNKQIKHFENVYDWNNKEEGE